MKEVGKRRMGNSLAGKVVFGTGVGEEEEETNPNVEEPAPFVVKISLLEGGIAPIRATEGSAGFDLYSAEDVELLPEANVLVGTGVKMAIPPFLYGQVAARSGMAKKGIHTFSGVIDSDYRGEIKVLLTNTNKFDNFQISKGNRIAQLLLLPCARPTLTVTDTLEETERGEKGFGSTGN